MKTDDNTSQIVCGTDHLRLSKHRAALCERGTYHHPAKTESQKASSEFSPKGQISYIPRCRGDYRADCSSRTLSNGDLTVLNRRVKVTHQINLN